MARVLLFVALLVAAVAAQQSPINPGDEAPPLDVARAHRAIDELSVGSPGVAPEVHTHAAFDAIRKLQTFAIAHHAAAAQAEAAKLGMTLANENSVHPAVSQAELATDALDSIHADLHQMRQVVNTIAREKVGPLKLLDSPKRSLWRLRHQIEKAKTA